MAFKIFYIDRINVFNSFGNFGHRIFNRIIKTCFGGGYYLNNFYN